MASRMTVPFFDQNDRPHERQDVRYRFGQVKVRLTEFSDAEKTNGEPLALLKKRLLSRLRRAGVRAQVRDISILKKSIDARNKRDVRLVYSLLFTVDRPIREKIPGLAEAPPSYDAGSLPRAGSDAPPSRPVITGFGPCGMFAALFLARVGFRPVVLEQGSRVEERVKKVDRFWQTGKLDPSCNVQFGEGGAGTFSDGKLTTGIHDPRIRMVLETFAALGAGSGILYDQKPHIGTDVLRTVVRNLREKVLDLGGEILFDTKMDGMETEGENGSRRISAVLAAGPSGRIRIPTRSLVLAPGHSARDTFVLLQREGVRLEQKPLSIGVRIEHPQAMIDVSQYGEEAAACGILPPASYKLVCHTSTGRGVYTFCMCPGGEVITASSEEGGVVVNGMSRRARSSGTANAGLLVDVRTEDFGDPDDPLAGIRFQRKWERAAFASGGGNYRPPRTTWAAFRDGSAEARPVLEALPDFAVRALREAIPKMGEKLKGFDRGDAVLTAVETRSSSPVRIVRNRETLQAPSLTGLFPGGEGAGYAGGIMSSACDGIRIAEQILASFRPEEPEKREDAPGER